MATREMPPAAPTDDVYNCGPREEQMLAFVDIVEVPLLQSLREEFGDSRGWALCGPASILLGNLISHNVGIPLGIAHRGERRDEHLEVAIGIFVPEADEPYEPMDHSYLLYDAGNHSDAVTLDMVGALLWEGHPELQKATRRDWHERWMVNYNMRYDHRVIPYEPGAAHRYGTPLWEDNTDPRSLLQNYLEFRCLMNSPQVFQNEVKTLSGNYRDVSAYWGERLVRVMQATARLAGVEVPPLA